MMSKDDMAAQGPLDRGVRGAVLCENPHWIGDEPAWDIALSNGTTHKDVTKRDIQMALSRLYHARKINYYNTIIDVVRERHIKLYDELHSSAPN